MNRINISFKNNRDQVLKGILELPLHQKPENFAVFAHCFTCNKNFHAPVNISKSLASRGYGVLRFDFTGLGESEGEFSNSDFSANINDIIAAVNYLTEEYSAPSLLIGHSLGGAAALLAALQLPSVKAVVSINAPSNLEHVKNHFQGNIEEIKKNGFAKVKIGGRDFKITSNFVEDLENNNNLSKINNLHKALLIMHSPQDKIVSIKHAESLYMAAKHPKSFISLDGSDHMISLKNDALYVGNVISAWAEKYIEFGLEKVEAHEHQITANLGKDGYTTQISTGKHHFIADEPESFGGEDLGPNPYEFVSAGLAACTSMTVQMYARHKGWLLENIETKVSYAKEHAEDCQHCEDKNTKLDTFRRKIKLEGKLEKTQMEKLLEIANRCPVHKTLSSSSQIITTSSEAET
ncbi:osmotically inducible protein C [Christiangramia fulva]|uniref:Osmotically inducible protein C n=1 Tax=Christiangramia fulva TaxID=2126553 RepID=A0A2R3Z762_9FLAO|nr:bifunctional alpha/beta hydrolase/OsmC family protein [Christiangramia fulva]AVR46110.1 osmotically inducible protein C [Christiangramia fulva]